jgi:hypothetical protein
MTYATAYLHFFVVVASPLIAVAVLLWSDR